MAREKTEADTTEDAFQPSQTGSLPPEAYQTQQDKVTASGQPAYPIDEPEVETAKRKKAEDDAKAKKAKDDEDEANHKKGGKR